MAAAMEPAIADWSERKLFQQASLVFQEIIRRKGVDAPIPFKGSGKEVIGYLHPTRLELTEDEKAFLDETRQTYERSGKRTVPFDQFLDSIEPEPIKSPTRRR